MSEDDDLLREASNPHATAERLIAIIDEVSTIQRAASQRGQLYPAGRGIWIAVIGNPSCPFWLLGSVLRAGSRDRNALVAWHNPSVPLLLLSEPRPEYRDAAARVLHRMGQDAAHPVLGTAEPPSLEALVRGWSSPHVVPERALPVLALARHLAGLFGLPWPATTP